MLRSAAKKKKEFSLITHAKDDKGLEKTLCIGLGNQEIMKSDIEVVKDYAQISKWQAGLHLSCGGSRRFIEIIDV